MSNVYGSGVPVYNAVEEADSGPIQIGTAFQVGLPSVLTHVRYYVATASMIGHTGGTLPVYAWRAGEPDSVVTGDLTIASTGWATVELSAPLFVPAGRVVGVALDFGSGTQSYGGHLKSLPTSNLLVSALASWWRYGSTRITDTDPRAWAYADSYLLDVEVAVSEMIHLDPALIEVGDELQIRRTISGTVNSVTPITDANTVNVTVLGGPLDGTDVDVWVPDTASALAAADMVLLKALPEPDLYSRWATADGAVWVYRGEGVYLCIGAGTAWAEGSKTTRADTPSLTTWP